MLGAASDGLLDMDHAFNVLRRYARDHGRRLSDVAANVVSRDRRSDDLIRHAKSVAVLP